MDQALEYDSSVDIYAEPTLTELVDNNDTILKHKIDKKIIEKFIDLLKISNNIKFVKLLRALINSNGSAIKLN